MTYRALTETCRGLSLFAVYSHCRGDKITAEAAVIYADVLGIPRSALRPDLWPPEPPATHDTSSAKPGESLGEA